MGYHYYLCITDFVDGEHFFGHYLNIWEYAAPLNYEHNLTDLSLDVCWTAPGYCATIVCVGTVHMEEMRGLIN